MHYFFHENMLWTVRFRTACFSEAIPVSNLKIPLITGKNENMPQFLFLNNYSF